MAVWRRKSAAVDIERNVFSEMVKELEPHDVGALGLKVIAEDVTRLRGRMRAHLARLEEAVTDKGIVYMREDKCSVPVLDALVRPRVLNERQFMAALSAGWMAHDALGNEYARPSLFAQGYALYVNALFDSGRVSGFTLAPFDIWSQAFSPEGAVSLQLYDYRQIAYDMAPELCAYANDLIDTAESWTQYALLPDAMREERRRPRTLMMHAGIGTACAQLSSFMDESFEAAYRLAEHGD